MTLQIRIFKMSSKMAEDDQETETNAITECPESDNMLDLKSIADNFAKLCAVDATNQLNKLESLVDSLLARSEECCTITDQIRGESKNLLFTSIPEFHKKCMEMQSIFKQIDLLEKFVATVKDNVDEMDEKVQLAERQLGNKNLKKILNSIPIPQYFAQKKQVQSYLKPEITEGEFVSPTIFKVEDFILSSEGTLDESKDSTNIEEEENRA